MLVQELLLFILVIEANSIILHSTKSSGSAGVAVSWVSLSWWNAFDFLRLCKLHVNYHDDIDKLKIILIFRQKSINSCSKRIILQAFLNSSCLLLMMNVESIFSPQIMWNIKLSIVNFIANFTNSSIHSFTVNKWWHRVLRVHWNWLWYGQCWWRFWENDIATRGWEKQIFWWNSIIKVVWHYFNYRVFREGWSWQRLRLRGWKLIGGWKNSLRERSWIWWQWLWLRLKWWWWRLVDERSWWWRSVECPWSSRSTWSRLTCECAAK